MFHICEHSCEENNTASLGAASWGMAESEAERGEGTELRELSPIPLL